VTKEGFARTPEALQKKKIRVAEAPLLMDIVRTIGSSPTPLPYGEIYSALQTGVIDGYLMDINALWTEKHYEVVKNVTLVHPYQWPVAVIANLDKFNSLSAEDQKILIEAAEETIDFNIDDVIELTNWSIEKLKEKGVKFQPVTDEEVQAFIDICKPIYDEYMAKDPRIKAFVEEVQEIKATSK